MAEQPGQSPLPTVVLAGATGYIGRPVAGELIARGYPVVALVRDSAAMPSLPADCQIVDADVTDAASVRSALTGHNAQVFISCLASRTGEPNDAQRVDHQANLNLLATAREADARHFILLSAICVQKPRLAFQHAKLAFEAALAESGLRYSIVRPTAFFKSLSGQVARVRAGKPFMMFGDGLGTACLPISERDLAAFMIDCLDDPARHNCILPIGGPGPALTPRDQGELLFELTGQPPRFRHVPVGIFSVMSALLAPLGAISTKIAAKAELARIGRYYATESMLLWNDARGIYDAESTPSFGQDTLRAHYLAMLESDPANSQLGDHRLF